MKHVKKQLSILSMLVALMLLTVISCAPDTEKEEDLICKVSVISGKGGTAISSENEVVSGWEVTITATPEDTYRFVNWTVGGKEVSKENPYTTAINQNTQFKANFEKDNYTLKVTAGEGGTVKATKEGELLNETEVTLTATPNEGYSFVNWTVNGEEVSTEATYTATITADTEFKANFRETYKPTGTENGHEYVDLGLSVKWATCNVGATTPEGYGDYFAWGETEPKTTYDLSTYKYCNGSYDTMTKYCVESNYGTVDNKTTLELTDDVARVNWGGKWRMPTQAEQVELKNTSNCTWTWTTQNGVNGYKVTSKKNGNSIFLPAAGLRDDSYLNYAGSRGFYWLSSLSTYYSYQAYRVCFDSSYMDWVSCIRSVGFSVRAVCE